MSDARNPIGPESFNLAGRVAIVTGGASGIGRATCLALSACGASVVVADLNADGARRVAGEVEARGGRAHPQQVDLGDEAAIREMIESAVRVFGGLDVLHNNAADSDPALMAADGAIVDLTSEVWDRNMRINLRAPMLGCKYAIPHMIRRGGGSIINTSSASGLTGDVVRAAYAASKAGLGSLTQNVAVQYGKQGIRCNAVAPGVIATPALEANVPKAAVDVYVENTLTPRLGRPEDIAAAVVFLASDASSFITGQVLSVDGGLLAHHTAMAGIKRLAG
ncbi:MAG: glucose 1-dehydrogenase [Myxococcota bacterium]